MGRRASQRASAAQGPVALGLVVLAGLAGCDRPGPLSAVERPPPAQPSWAAPLAGRSLASVFPATDICAGAIDRVSDRFHGARRLVGWGWDQTRGAAVARLAVVDPAGAMVGFGEGGTERPDVPVARPEVRSPRTGWTALAPTGGGYSVYGVDPASGAACRLGAAPP